MNGATAKTSLKVKLTGRLSLNFEARISSFSRIFCLMVSRGEVGCLWCSVARIFVTHLFSTTGRWNFEVIVWKHHTSSNAWLVFLGFGMVLLGKELELEGVVTTKAFIHHFVHLVSRSHGEDIDEGVL
ncbi:hypothetical protein Tco_1149121 [Tanacetum coccineum]